MRRRDHADIDLDRRLASDRQDLAALDGAEKLGLHGRAHLADLIEEQRARVGQLEEPGLVAIRSGERPLLVAEQLALQQRLGERRTVHGEERSVDAVTALVQRPGDQLLAGSRFADDQHGQPGRRQLLDQVVHLLHRAGRADQVVEAIPQLEARAARDHRIAHLRDLVSLGRHGLLELPVQTLEVGALRLDLPPHGRGVERQPGLVGQSRGQIEIVFRERAALAPAIEVHRAGNLLPDPKRDGEHGASAELVQVVLASKPLLRRGVTAKERLTGCHRLPGDDLSSAPEVAGVLSGNDVPALLQHEQTAIGPGQLQRGFEDGFEKFVVVPGGVQRPADLEQASQRRVLALEPGELAAGLVRDLPGRCRHGSP